ncbi:MAG: hypothetical protein KDB01_27100, partial [Planctomycetaceae bacterium]|nr:hypothetical protein [Planctomycetaceae bacterium]
LLNTPELAPLGPAYIHRTTVDRALLLRQKMIGGSGQGDESCSAQQLQGLVASSTTIHTLF